MVNVYNVLGLLLSAIIYPGLIFLVIAGLLTQWFMRKLIGRLQNRIGPKYVGPLGIAQPFADVMKLLLVKEELSFKGGLNLVMMLFVFLGLGALAVAMLFTPLSTYTIAAPYDVILFIYLMLWVTLAFGVVGLSLSNPFTVAGSSRFLSLILFAEPALVTSLIAVVVALSAGSRTPFSVYAASVADVVNVPAALVLALAFISYILAMLAKMMIKPFDIPEAETELAGGLFAELSGPTLAFAIIAHDAELAFLTLIATLIFLRGPYPLTYGEPLGLLIILIKYLLLITLITIIKASVGRVRVEQASSIVLKYSFTLSIVSIVAAALIQVFITT